MWIFISLFILAKFINCKLNEEYTQNEQNNTTTIQIVEFLPIYSQQLKRQSNLSLQSDVPSYVNYNCVLYLSNKKSIIKINYKKSIIKNQL